MILLEELNRLPAEPFVAALDGIFEHSPWVAERVAGQRPFATGLDLHEALCAAVARAPHAEQLALIRAHPELAGRAAIRGELTLESAREQAGAGLNECSAEEYARLHAANRAYRDRHGFPFILAVKGHTRASIIAALEQRAGHATQEELQVALGEIGRIAAFRLAERLEEPAGALIVAMAQRLARHSEQPDALTCTYLTPAHRATAAALRDFMLCAGLSVTTDAAGNVIGRWQGPGPGTLLTGSHYDTVINAGRYDGRLGVLLPVAVIAELKRAGVQPACSITVIAFAEEEGVRFGSTFLGARALAGTFDTGVLEATDAAGIRMREAMQAAGLDPEQIPAAALPREELAREGLAGFVEVHIEQGPVLLAQDAPLGVVTSIAGSTRGRLSVTGLAGHAGTVPMSQRRDAAAAAAEMVLAVERRCQGTPGLVGTVGQLQVPEGAVNVIPGRCELSLDIRAERDEVRSSACQDVLAEIREIAARRQVQVRWQKTLETPSVPCAPALQERLAQSVQRITGAAAPRLPSGAGHDTMIMAQLTPAAMLFVRSGNGGISHHPGESVDAADVELAARVFADFIRSP
jgi:beta-ureidopropionase / N-carbamoyl-L-amino-acid hydrolase